MNPSTSFHFFHRADPDGAHGVIWAMVIAVLFALIAALSFAVDQSITLSNVPAAPEMQTIQR